MNEFTIFDILYPKKKITKPIRLIELFGGYGSQALALKYLGVKFEHWKLVEWAVKSIQAYKDIHFPNQSALLIGLNKEQEVERLYKQGISSNYNEPMTKEQINRLSLQQIYKITENNIITHNLVNIQQVKGKDLEIVDIDKYEYIMTYSFPCQDLSLAGKGKGMSDTSTRSGMLWEVERILGECEHKPQILLMENVPQVHSEDNLNDFNKWKLRLEEFGYKNYFQDLIATDYGIPQTRNRCFMISLLGDYSYTFPKPISLKLKLKDMLENNVDEKYYLSDKMIKYITSKDDKYKVNENNLVINRDIACSKTTREGNTRADTTDYICDELPNNYKLLNLASDELLKNNKVKENDVLLTNFISRRIKENDIIQNNNITPTLTTSATEIAVVVNKPHKIGSLYEDKQAGSIYSENAMCPTLTTKSSDNWNILLEQNDLRIRKLTPKECFRLMGVRDEDYERVAKNQSDSSLYHLAGDSIVVNVLMAIFKELL